LIVPSMMPRLFTAGRVCLGRSRIRIALWCAICAFFLVADGCTRRRSPNKPPANGPASGSSFTATAYCTGKVTASGTAPTAHTVAADPAVLPLGSQIRLTGLDKRYNGVYLVKDTGGGIRGRRIDLYIRDCREAVRFGRRSARVSVVH
jgi:3D (Asp-Asp-Asp) domain-containing protein